MKNCIILAILIIPYSCTGQKWGVFFGVSELSYFKQELNLLEHPDSVKIGDFRKGSGKLLPINLGGVIRRTNTDFFVNLVFAHQKSNSPFQSTNNGNVRTSDAKSKSFLFEGNLGIRKTKFRSTNFNIQLSHSIGLSYSKSSLSFSDKFVTEMDNKLWLSIDTDERYPVTFNFALNSGILFNYNIYKKIGIGLEFAYGLNYRFSDGINSASIKAEYFEEDGSSNRVETYIIKESANQKRVFLRPIFGININYNI